MIQNVDAILKRLQADGRAKVGSLDELIAWAFEDEERLERLSARDEAYISKHTGIPRNLVHTILHSRYFVQAVYDEVLFRSLTPGRLKQIYENIARQLLSDEITPGSKAAMLNLLLRQMGLEKPRKLSVKQQSEVVVRVEHTKPVEVLEVLGVPVDENAGAPEEAKALPENTADAVFRSLGIDEQAVAVPDYVGRGGDEGTGGDTS